jgi:hypothetical protein
MWTIVIGSHIVFNNFLIFCITCGVIIIVYINRIPIYIQIKCVPKCLLISNYNLQKSTILMAESHKKNSLKHLALDMLAHNLNLKINFFYTNYKG